jgi:hypothetical protein
MLRSDRSGSYKGERTPNERSGSAPDHDEDHYGWVSMSGLTRQKRAPLPDPLREDVIELLSTLLLAEIARNPDVYRAGPEGGPTVTVPDRAR